MEVPMNDTIQIPADLIPDIPASSSNSGFGEAAVICPGSARRAAVARMLHPAH
jgi:hypothetical protein